MAIRILGRGSATAPKEAPPIRTNTPGFLPAQEKRATIAASGTRFSVVRASNGVRPGTR